MLEEVLRQNALRVAAPRHLPGACPELRQLAIEIRPRLAHFRPDDSRFAIHSEFSFSVDAVSGGTACTFRSWLRPAERVTNPVRLSSIATTRKPAQTGHSSRSAIAVAIATSRKI